MRPLPETLPTGIIPNTEYPALATDHLGRRRFAHFNYDEVDPAMNAQIQEIYNWTWEKYGHLYDEGKGDEYERLVRETGVDTLKEKLHAKAEREFQQLDRMIPIVISSDHPFTREDSLSGECARTVILWYRMTPDLLKRLPSGWRERMKIVGVSSFSSVRVPDPVRKNDHNGDLERTPEGTGKDGEGVSGTSTQGHGARWSYSTGPLKEGGPVTGSSDGRETKEHPGAILEGQLIPLPIKVEGRLQLKMRDDRTVAISLHSIVGTRLKVLLGDTFMEKGEHGIPLHFDQVPPGIYLLAISTDQNELRLLRIIIE